MTRQEYGDAAASAARRLHADKDWRAYCATLEELTSAWSAEHGLPRPFIVNALDKPGTQRVVLAQRLPRVVG